MGRCLHVLDVYRKSLLWEDPISKSRRHKKYGLTNQEGDEIIRSATELNEAGIRFKKSKTGSLKDISFHGGILRLPLIVVDDATESMFLNQIAFERFHVGAGNEVTSYIFFMDNIIDNVRDVSLLHSQGIIQNAIGSDKAVAKLFNSLSKDTTLDPDSSLDAVHKKVHNYCKKPWNEWRANLIHTYFRNPWAILSVIAAIFLFGLTIVQTIYGICSYYSQSNALDTFPLISKMISQFSLDCLPDRDPKPQQIIPSCICFDALSFTWMPSRPNCFLHAFLLKIRTCSQIAVL
ncbi:hypothetical protein RJ640_011733 [Escallonia rubra]|uniref:Uncharacterized protein n=1 Tax=Escallonia rubra TaxID=112253 RepID=A0AA88U8D4_9ASTE|nr:hypothetical protein RJ640_011733 [Escallonia rubra]